MDIEKPAWKLTTPEQQAEMIRLYEEEHLGSRVIADRMGINIGSVHHWVKKHKRNKLSESVDLSHEGLVAARDKQIAKDLNTRDRRERTFTNIALRLLRKAEAALFDPTAHGFNVDSALNYSRAVDVTLERHRRVLGLPDPPKSRARKE